MILGSYLIIGFLFSYSIRKSLYLYSGLEMIKNKKVPTRDSLLEAQFIFMGIITIMWGFFIIISLLKLIKGKV